VLRPCQAVVAPNVPHDIAEREEEERLLGSTFVWSSRIEKSALILHDLHDL